MDPAESLQGAPAPAPADNMQRARNRVNKANRNTVAASWNIKGLRGLEAALLREPEADLSALLTPSYRDNLESFKTSDTRPGIRPQPSAESRYPVQAPQHRPFDHSIPFVVQS